MLNSQIEINAQDVANYLNNNSHIKTSDPNLLINASGRFGNAQVTIESCPGPMSRFGKGFVSYPITWWSTHIHTAMLKGLFGTKQRMVAQMRQDILGVILYEARNNKAKTLQVAQFYAQHKLSSDKAGFAGRVLGGVFTTHATTRLPGQKKSPLNGKAKTAVGMANFIISSYGAAIYAIAKGAKKFEDIITMILVGDYNATLCVDMSKLKLSSNASIKYNPSEHKIIFELLDGVDALNQKHRNFLTPIDEFKN